MNRFFKSFISFTVIGLIFYYLLRETITHWDELSASNWNPKYSRLILSQITLLFFALYRGYVWQMILKLYNGPLSYKNSFYVITIASFVKYIPGKIWQYIGKVYLSSREGVPVKVSTIAISIELIITLLSGFLSSLCFLSYAPQNPINIPVYIYPIIILTGFAIIHEKCLNKIIEIGAKIFKKEYTYISYAYKTVLIIFIHWFFVWALYSMGSFFFITAFTDIGMGSIGLFLFLIPFSWIIGYLSIIAPDGIGIRELTLALPLKSLIPIATITILLVALRFWILISEVVIAFVVILFNWDKFFELILQKDKKLNNLKETA